MRRSQTAILGTILVTAFASGGFAQDTTTAAPADTTTTPAPADTTAAPALADTTAPAAAGTAAVPAAADCDAEFATLDADGNGYLSEAEAQRAYARSRIGEATIAGQGISKDEYAALCASPEWTKNTPEEGAPFEGANSFTEEQARDRAVAWNVTDVSALTKDDKGVWRGTGKLDGKDVSVAVDYKGNVVTGTNP